MGQLFSDPSLIKISSWSTLKCVLYSQSHGEQISDWPDLSLEKVSKREGYQEFCVYGWVAYEESYCIEISLHSLNEWNKVSVIDPELRAIIWLVLIPCDPILVNKWTKSPVAQMVKNLSAVWETWFWSLSQEDPLEKEMTTHSNILAWRIPRTEKLGRLQSMLSQIVRHNWVTNATILMQIQSNLIYLSKNEAYLYRLLVTRDRKRIHLFKLE